MAQPLVGQVLDLLLEFVNVKSGELFDPATVRLLALPPRTPKGGATIHVFGDPVADPVIAVDRTPGKPVGAWTVQVLLAKTAASVGTWTFWAEGDDALGRTVVTEETQVRVGGGSVLALE